MMIGIYIFFLLSSFRGKVEANWTSPVLVSLIVLSHQSLLERINWRKILYKLLPITLVLVLVARIIMVADILPFNEIRARYHSWKEWPKVTRSKTGGLPVVFSNSYQRASKYWFYSGQMTYSQNWYRERRNNFNFWPVEDSLLGKPVFFMDKYQLARFPDSIKTPIGFVGYKYDSSLVSLAKLQFDLEDIRLTSGQKTTLYPKISIPTNYKSLLLNRQVMDTIRIGIFDKKGWVKDLETGLRIQNLVKEEKAMISFDPQLPRGKYFLLFTIQVDGYNATHNSRKIGLKVD